MCAFIDICVRAADHPSAQGSEATFFPLKVSPTMDTDTHHPQENEFGTSQWVEMGGYNPPQHTPSMPDYHGFGYPSPIMPMEPSYSMSIPPPYASLPLTMPSHPWPSMLTTQSHFPEATLPPTPIPTSISPPAPVHPIRTSNGPTPRRTLTDEDRRRMCLYHEENRSAKQTDIGGNSTKDLLCLNTFFC